MEGPGARAPPGAVGLTQARGGAQQMQKVTARAGVERRHHHRHHHPLPRATAARMAAVAMLPLESARESAPARFVCVNIERTSAGWKMMRCEKRR